MSDTIVLCEKNLKNFKIVDWRAHFVRNSILYLCTKTFLTHKILTIEPNMRNVFIEHFPLLSDALLVFAKFKSEKKLCIFN